MTTWLITGANRGIGLGLTRHLIARGDQVIAGARQPSKAEALQALAKDHAALTVVALDVTSKASIDAARTSLGNRAIDVLVNNAGIYAERGKGVLEADLDAFAETLMINTVAPMRVIQGFAALMTKGSKAVTISSRMGSLAVGGGGEFIYRASKAGVNKAIQSVAPELAARGITAVVMHPGWVRTDMGGGGADLAVEQSTAGIIKTIDAITPNDAGRFINWDGAPIAW